MIWCPKLTGEDKDELSVERRVGQGGEKGGYSLGSSLMKRPLNKIENRGGIMHLGEDIMTSVLNVWRRANLR